MGPQQLLCSLFCCKHVKVVPVFSFLSVLPALALKKSFLSWGFTVTLVSQFWLGWGFADSPLDKDTNGVYFIDKFGFIWQVLAFLPSLENSWVGGLSGETEAKMDTVSNSDNDVPVYTEQTESCFWKRLRNLLRDSVPQNLCLQVDCVSKLMRELIKHSLFLSFISPCAYSYKMGFRVHSLPTRPQSSSVWAKHSTFHYHFTRTKTRGLEWSITELWRLEGTSEVSSLT